ncbi:MAG: hypothetical protein HYS40_02200 [Gemmatimonadetes bacterium]|nr:hypothetical protein [Gemmatimonadota bacterium]
MIPFHRLLIATAIVFCAGFALWAFGRYLAFKSLGMLALTLAFALFATALAYYLRHLKRFLGR